MDSFDFAAWVTGFAKGKTNTDLTQEMTQIVRRVDETGKPGTLTLALTIAPIAGVPSGISVKARVNSKPPREDPVAVFFATQSGALTRDDPAMEPMFSTNQIGATDDAASER